MRTNLKGQNGAQDVPWSELQKTFWDGAAARYDQLYEGRWSQLEDAQVQQRLSDLLQPECSILDLGCGTGLGYSLASKATTIRKYVGMDISPEMIEIAKKRFPEGTFEVQDMAALPDLPDRHFDAVLALFTTLSYSSDPKRTLADAFDTLKPGGVLMVSCLSRFSLRRITKGQYGVVERYGSRGIGDDIRPQAHTFASREIRRLAHEVGFASSRVWGQSVLSGVLEHPPLWNMSRMLSRASPDLAHNLYLEAVRGA